MLLLLIIFSFAISAFITRSVDKSLFVPDTYQFLAFDETVTNSSGICNHRDQVVDSAYTNQFATIEDFLFDAGKICISSNPDFICVVKALFDHQNNTNCQVLDVWFGDLEDE